MGKNKKVMVWSLIGIISVVLIVIGISYALWTLNFSQSGINQITTKCFRLDFIEEVNSNIGLRETYPISEEDGRNLVPYTFKVINECDAKAKYTIRLETLNNTTMAGKYIKSLLNNGVIKPISEYDETGITLDNASKSYVIENSTINGHEEKSYELRLWIDGSVSSDNKEVMNKIFESKVTIEGDYDPTYTEEILHGTDPVLSDGLVPVVIDDSGVVRKADINSKWYSYGEKMWANAVILEDETKVYQDNEEIPENEIESYFVWIPRYRYQIFDNGLYYELSENVESKEQEIKIEFESRSTRVSKGTKKGDWLTHPAFTSFDVNGIWVGKFETGYKGATTTEGAQQNVVDTEKVQIKPNVYSWRGIQVSNAHLNSYNYKRNMDSHMMKNTEWGAVAYLQHSRYGSRSSVRINNNESYITGYSAVREPTCGYTGTNENCNRYESTVSGLDGTYSVNYKNSASVLSSTTGNYSGIYDMSGGAWEYVMGVMADKNNNLVSGSDDNRNSGFIGTLTFPSVGTNKSKTNWTAADGGIPFPEEKYYDLYAYGESDDAFYRRILGDATGEMGPFANVTYATQTRQIGSWYQDESSFVNSAYPWFTRGWRSGMGLGAGIFAYYHLYGIGVPESSYRIVLTM